MVTAVGIRVKALVLSKSKLEAAPAFQKWITDIATHQNYVETI
jgi:hypothetical protein